MVQNVGCLKENTYLCNRKSEMNALLAQLVEQLTLNQWVQGSSPWRCTTTKSELFPIGEGFGFFVFFGKQNESIASPEK